MEGSGLGAELVVRPGREAAIDPALIRLGWAPEGRGAWRRPGGFPTLRVQADDGFARLDVGLVPPRGRAAIASEVPLADAAWVEAQLADPDAARRATALRIAAVARVLGPAVARAALDPDPSVAAGARALLDAARRRERARAELAVAAGLLAGLAHPVIDRISAADVADVIPSPEEAAAVFAPEVAGRAGEVYAAWWAVNRSRVRAVGATSLPRVYPVPAGLLREDDALLRPIPQGFRGVAGALLPSVTWIAWRYPDVGSTRDGLVFVDHRWRWWPQPYKVLRPLLAELWG